MSRRLALLAIAVVGVVVVAVVVRESTSSQPVVQIQLLEYEALDDEVGVSLTISNSDDEPQTVRSWWYLAGLTDDEPWLNSTYRSRVVESSLAPGESTTVRWDDVLAVEEGTYRLSSWVHVAGAAGFDHADGRFGDVVIQASGSPTVRRAIGPDPELGFDRIDVGRDAGADGTYPAAIAVRGPDGEAVDVVITWGYEHPDGARVIDDDQRTSIRDRTTVDVRVSPPESDDDRFWVELRRAGTTVVLDHAYSSISAPRPS